ncbi:MAG: thiamine-phosphate kinase [Polyangiaceae bacterium]|nr:thiamine-phosphate kinase [Polyangiaceae bacterium]
MTERRSSRVLTERDAVRRLGRIFRGNAALLGIGDDAACVRLPPRGQLVLSVDAAFEHVHFELDWLSLTDIGYRAHMAALSDLAAMGARPRWALSAVSFPKGATGDQLSALGRGQARAAREAGAPVVGGNLARGAGWSVTTTVIGTARAPLTRSGARAGDELWLLGEVGLSGAGLSLFRRGGRPLRSSLSLSAERAAKRAFRRPLARIADGLALRGRAHAVIDVSDGLAGDALHLAQASGVRVVLERPALEALLHPALLAVARALGQDAVALALAGGEDYALLAAGPPARRPRAARVVGRVEAGRGAVLLDGARRLVLDGGFDHFVSDRSRLRRARSR